MNVILIYGTPFYWSTKDDWEFIYQFKNHDIKNISEDQFLKDITIFNERLFGINLNTRYNLLRHQGSEQFFIIDIELTQELNKNSINKMPISQLRDYQSLVVFCNENKVPNIDFTQIGWYILM